MEKNKELSVVDFAYSPKQEAFCYAYVELGDMSAAYRKAYSATNMKSTTIGVKASQMLSQDKYRIKVEAIRGALQHRNEITLDEIVQDLARMARFDPGELYDENGDLRNIKEMPKEARQMIASMDIEALYEMRGTMKVQVGHTKKVKMHNRLDILEKLMKYFDGYNKHNQSKAPTSQVLIVQLPDNNRG